MFDPKTIQEHGIFDALIDPITPDKLTSSNLTFVLYNVGTPTQSSWAVKFVNEATHCPSSFEYTTWFDHAIVPET